MQMKPRLVTPDFHAESSGMRVLCSIDDLIPDSGVCALLDGEQVALFYLPDCDPPVYAIGNYDPIGDANVLSRGIVGDLKGELVVASPLYKHHYALGTGHCIEDASISVPTYPVMLKDGLVLCTAPA